jgi:hypothetical protein
MAPNYGSIAAILGSAAISAYSSNKAADAQQRAIGNASATSAGATRDALARSDYYNAQARSDLSAYRTLGRSALTDYAGLVDKYNEPFNFKYTGSDEGRNKYRGLVDELNVPFEFDYSGEMPGDFEFSYDGDAMRDDPGYQFRMSEMEQALERGMSARGMNRSGRTMRELARYSGGLASQGFADDYARNYGLARDVYDSQTGNYDRGFATELTEYNSRAADRNARAGRLASVAEMDQEDYNRQLTEYNSQAADRQNRLARLAGVVGMGQAATNQTVSTAQQAGQIGSNLIQAGGQQRAGLQIAAGNATPYAGYNSAAQGAVSNLFAMRNQQTQNQMTQNFMKAMGNSYGHGEGK